MSYQDVRSYYEERDDVPEPIKAPEGVKPGERFMEKAPHGRYDVCDWDEERCGCGCEGEPSSKCSACDGKGWFYTVPSVTYTDMEYCDAFLLIHGMTLYRLAILLLDAKLDTVSTIHAALKQVTDKFKGE